MNTHKLAALLTGRTIGNEITDEEEQQAVKDGLIVVYGASDDLMEFRGAIHDELSMIDGGEAYITQDGVLQRHDDCECEYCGYDAIKKKAKSITAIWCGEGEYSWTYKTKIPHATFEIAENGEPYCRGIVFCKKDL